MPEKLGMCLVWVLDCHHLYCCSLGQVPSSPKGHWFSTGLSTLTAANLAMNYLKGSSRHQHVFGKCLLIIVLLPTHDSSCKEVTGSWHINPPNFIISTLWQDNQFCWPGHSWLFQAFISFLFTDYPAPGLLKKFKGKRENNSKGNFKSCWLACQSVATTQANQSWSNKLFGRKGTRISWHSTRVGKRRKSLNKSDPPWAKDCAALPGKFYFGCYILKISIRTPYI